MRRGDADDLDRAKLQVHLDFGDLRTIAINSIRRSLTILVEWYRWRVKLSSAPAQPEFVGWHFGKLDTARGAAIGDDNRSAIKAYAGVLAHMASRRMSARSRRPDSSAALPVMNVCREADVLPQSGVRAVSGPTSSKSASGMPSASAQIWVITVFEPWPMSVAP